MTKLDEIILCGDIERKFIENTMIGGIIAPLIHIREHRVFIYGGGDDIELIVLYLEYLDIEICGIIDRNPSKKSQKVFDRIPFVYTEDLPNVVKDIPNPFVIINVGQFSGINSMEITRFLTDCGITNIYALDDYDKLQIKTYNPLYKQFGFSRYFFENRQGLSQTYEMLYDDDSKDAMCEYIRVYMQAGVYHLPQIDGRRKYFFGDDVSEGVEQLYKKKMTRYG